MSQTTPHNQFLDSIQIGRAFAALAVALQHTIRDADRYYPRYSDSNPAYTGDPNGWVELLGAGVDVFFVISGVVMVMSTWQGHGSIGLFLYRRAARIYPLYWVLTLAFIGVLILAPSIFQETYLDPVHATCSLFLVPCTGPGGEALPYIYAGWTLSYELVFYALFALSLLASSKAAQLLSCIILVLLYHSLHYTPLSNIPAIEHTSSNIMLEFIFGILLGYAYFHYQFQRAWSIPLLLFGLLLMLLSHTGVFVEWPRFIRWGIPAFFIVAGLMCVNIQRENQAKWYKALVFLGAASYALYLFHFFSLKLFYVIAGKLGLLSMLAPALGVVLALLVTLIASIAVHLLCEKPLSHLSKKLMMAPHRTTARN